MKKILLLATLTAFSATGVFAQKYDEIKTALSIGKIAEAKKLFDKGATNEKFYKKPEGYMVAAILYSNLALDSALAADASKNKKEAETALNKYKEMDPEMKLLQDPAYKNAPYNLYAYCYNTGITNINNQAYEAAYENFRQTVDYSELLIQKKIMDKQMDTAAIYYAGLLAENTKHYDEALKYYNRISDKKIKEYTPAGSTQPTSYETVYQGLVRYYANKNDNANFEKYKALGKELFPQSEFFTYSMLDFAVGASSDFNERVANLEKLATTSPQDYKAQITLAEIIYDTLDSRKEGAVLPGNAAELEVKMLEALNKAITAKSDEIQPYLLLGDHKLLKSEKLRSEMITAEINLTKKGKKATADDKARLTNAQKVYNESYESAKENYEKAADIYAKMPQLNSIQKRSYRAIAGNLAEYYSYKIESAKNPADRDKFAALEKKWDALFTKLR